MFWGILAGAGLIGLLDSALRLGLPDAGMWRESAIVVLCGDLAIAIVVGAAVTRAARGQRRAGSFGFGLGCGLGLAGAPLLGSLLPVEPFGLAALCLGLLLAFPLGRLVPGPGGPARLLAAVAPAVLLAALLVIPPSDIYADAAPPLPEPPGLRAATAPPLPAGAPDILLLSIDTLRADRVLALADHLPHLSALRARGTWADYGLSSTNQTVPAHVTMLSGLSSLEHGVRHNHDRMGPAVPLIAEDLRAAGWNTAAVISNGLLRRATGFARGFDAFDDSAVAATGRKLAFRRMVKKDTWLGWLSSSQFVFERLVPWLLPRPEDREGPSADGRRTTDGALRYLRELRQRPEPFFLFVHYLDPHHPYRPPPETAGLFFELSDLPDEYRGEKLADNAMMYRLRDELAGDDPAARARARAGARALVPLYDEEIVAVDRLIGELLAAVEESGRPTVIVFTADHGEHFGEHDLVLHSCSLYEELVRVPFVIAGPGVPARRLEQPPHLEDVVPTLRALAGLPPAPELTGRDLAAAAAPPPQRHVERYQRWLAVREGNWKLIARFAGTEVEPLELYDLAADPAEQRNLLAERSEDAARLAAVAREELASARTLERGGGAADADLQQALLEELGYLGDGHGE